MKDWDKKVTGCRQQIFMKTSCFSSTTAFCGEMTGQLGETATAGIYLYFGTAFNAANTLRDDLLRYRPDK